MIRIETPAFAPQTGGAERSRPSGKDWKGFRTFLEERAERLGDRTALDFAPAGPEAGAGEAPSRSRFSYADLSAASLALAGRLARLGVGPGHHVAILSESRPEWGIAFFAAMISGAVVIPLDPKATLEELRAITSDCRPRLLFASPECLAKALALAAEKQVLDLDSLRDAGPGGAAGSDGAEGRWAEAAFPDKRLRDTALIVYTSGTTGSPKGVMITVGNLWFQMEALVQGFRIRKEDVFLSILPLHHLLELTCGMLGVIHGGARIVYCRSLFPEEVTAALRASKATFMITVPYFLRLLAGRIRATAARKPGPRRLLFAFWQAAAPLLPAAFRARIFRPVHQALGGQLRGFISGGAPLDAATEDFLSRLGVDIYQGYGLTETGPVISVNRPGGSAPGSVGRPLPGAEVRFQALDGGDADEADEGEILTRGPHVMAGYHGRRDLTALAVDPEGWLHTGDIGRLDGGGYLRITGRIKSLIVLEGGKKVHPEEVEEALGRLASVREACVLAWALPGGKEEIAAVVVPQGEWLRPGSGLQDPEEPLRREIDRAMAALSPYKRPARIVFSERELPRTAARKIRREAVRRELETEMLRTWAAEGGAIRRERNA